MYGDNHGSPLDGVIPSPKRSTALFPQVVLEATPSQTFGDDLASRSEAGRKPLREHLVVGFDVDLTVEPDGVLLRARPAARDSPSKSPPRGLVGSNPTLCVKILLSI